MELLLLCGFLGSGKTTLVMGLAKELAAEGRKSAFVVNEVGEIGVDQQVMRAGGLEVFEITSGCICCQIGPDLVKTLELLAAEYRPEIVLIEASGVAYPDGVLEALRYYRGEPFTRIRRLGVIDPTRLEALLEVMTPLVEGQIYQADELIVTKIDEANDEELVRACEVARRLNPTAPLRLVCAVDEASLSRVAKELLARTNQTE